METTKDYRDLLNFKKVTNTQKNVIEVWVEWDSNDADYIESSNTIKPEQLFENKKLIYCLAYVTLNSDFKKDGGYKRDCARFGQYVPDNRDIKNLISELNKIDFVSYSEWGPCHTLINWSLTYYNDNGVPNEICFDKIYKEFEGMSYKEICDLINSL